MIAFQLDHNFLVVRLQVSCIMDEKLMFTFQIILTCTYFDSLLLFNSNKKVIRCDLFSNCLNIHQYRNFYSREEYKC